MRFFEQAKNFERQPFANFQGDISDESIADDDVDDAGEKIAAFDVADEVDGTFLEARVDFAGQFVAFNFFFADGEQADARAAISESGAVIDLAHDRELDEVLGLGIDVGADIEQDGDAALGVGERRGQSDAIDGFESA